jgi:hypothetical protein
MKERLIAAVLIYAFAVAAWAQYPSYFDPSIQQHTNDMLRQQQMQQEMQRQHLQEQMYQQQRHQDMERMILQQQNMELRHNRMLYRPFGY